MFYNIFVHFFWIIICIIQKNHCIFAVRNDRKDRLPRLSNGFSLRRNLLTFGDGIWAAVFIALKRQTSEEMKTISLKRESTAMQSAKALAEKALEFLTSPSLTLISGIVALFAVMAAVVNHNWGTFHTVAVMTFAVIMALSMTIDIEKGGVA